MQGLSWVRVQRTAYRTMGFALVRAKAVAVVALMWFNESRSLHSCMMSIEQYREKLSVRTLLRASRDSIVVSVDLHIAQKVAALWARGNRTLGGRYLSSGGRDPRTRLYASGPCRGHFFVSVNCLLIVRFAYVAHPEGRCGTWVVWVSCISM